MSGKFVAIVGRPNVGKSTLFNRLTGKRKAIINDTSGVTRDRQYDYADWNGKEFAVVDTGGYVEHSSDIFEKEIKKQVEFAINEADLILFMVDVTVGITDQDQVFTRFLKRVDKKIIVVANKADNYQRLGDMYEFYKLGFEDIIPISAINGSGTGELLDKVVESLDFDENSSIELFPNVPKVSVVGKPNVGKSTFINALLGEERNIVSDIPGTTRDSIHSVYNKYGREFILIDTAGLRKKSVVSEDVEFYSVLRAIKAMEESDVCFLIIDAEQGLQSQDMAIFSLIMKRNKGVVILLNKWDVIEKDSNTADQFVEHLKMKLAPFSDVPIVTISALNKTRLMKAVDEVFKVYENRIRKISTSELNKVMLPVIESYHPPSVRGKLISIKYVTQIAARHPVFAFFCNYPEYIREPYKRFLENKLRDSFQLSGVPVTILFRKK